MPQEGAGSITWTIGPANISTTPGSFWSGKTASELTQASRALGQPDWTSHRATHEGPLGERTPRHPASSEPAGAVWSCGLCKNLRQNATAPSFHPGATEDAVVAVSVLASLAGWFNQERSPRWTTPKTASVSSDRRVQRA